MLGVMALQYDLNLFYVFCGEVLTKECCSVESIVNCSEIFIYLSIYLLSIHLFKLMLKLLLKISKIWKWKKFTQTQAFFFEFFFSDSSKFYKWLMTKSETHLGYK